MVASGLKLVVPASFTDTSLPVLYDDAMLTAGSLALYQPDHSANPITGVPAAGSAVPNIAWRQLAAARGDSNPVSTAYGGLWADQGTRGAAGNFAVERTAKGGVHAALSASAGNSIGTGLLLGQNLVDYLVANYSHAFFFSLWQVVTRAPGSTAGESQMAVIPYSSKSTTALAVLASSDGTTYPTTATRVGYRRLGNGTTLGQFTTTMPIPQSQLFNAGISSFNGGAPTESGATAQRDSKAFGVGCPQGGSGPGGGPYNATGNAGAMLGKIFYRFYLEDLTVSGRTYAAVDALDLARWTADVNTAGGRYYGDTYTAPATLMS